MRGGLLAASIALLLATLFAVPAFAKSPPDGLTIEGPGLAVPVEITDPADLAAFSPWGRGFVAWELGLAAAPPPLERTYTVSFRLEGRTIYVVHYAPDLPGGRGYLYFPGPDHASYRLNIGTIMGASSSDPWAPEGKWHFATAQWDAVLQSALRTRRTAGVALPATLPASGGAPLAGGANLLAGGIVLLAAGLRLRRRGTSLRRAAAA